MVVNHQFWLGVKEKYHHTYNSNSIQIKETRDGETEAKILNTLHALDTSQSLFTFSNENLQQMKTSSCFQYNPIPETPGGQKNTNHTCKIPTSTFGILRGFTSFLQTNFLPLNHSGISGKKSFLSQWCSMIFAHLQQGTGNAKRDCLCLTRQATTLSFDKNIITTFISQSYQRDLNVLKPQWVSLKIFLHKINVNQTKKRSKGNNICQLQKDTEI